jgi:hypothetical protein
MAGSVFKGKTVTIVSADEQIPAKAKTLVQEHGVRDPKQAVVRFTHLERTFRTREEQELSRDFTPEEARGHEQRWELRFAVMAEERSRAEIADTIAQIATRLERAAGELRRELASQADPAQQAERAQHAVAWLFPNLGADHLTRSAIEWSMSKDMVTRLLTEGIAPAEPSPSANPASARPSGPRSALSIDVAQPC